MTTPLPRALHVSARLRLALSYAVFLVAAGAILLFGVYLVLRYVPDYPLTAANPRDTGGSAVASRGEILDAVVGVSGLALLALAAIGLSGGWILAGWILRPLRRINRAAEMVAAGDMQHRIRLGGRNDEFRQVADNFDHMLDQVNRVLESHERFTANASHELRTPLAVTATMLEVALRAPGAQEIPVLLTRLQMTNNRAIGLTESLLRLADVNEVKAAAETIDLAEVFAVIIEENRAEAHDRSVVLSVNLESVFVAGDPSLIAQLVINLVHNAIRHSGSPGSASVSVRQDEVAGRALIRISGGARIFSADEASRLAEPFLRGEGRISGDGHGYGLGLPLVERIAEAHGGHLVLRPGTRGGLVVTVDLPLEIEVKEA